MSEYNIKDFIKESQKQEAFYKEQIGKFDKLLDDYQNKINDLQKRKDTTLNDIAKKYVPVFNDSGLQKFSGIFKANNVISFVSEMKNEKLRIENRIKLIEAEDEFQKAEALIDPQNGVIATQVMEIKPIYDQAKVIVTKLESNPAFSGLLERHYGTSSYPHKGFFKYFSKEYLNDWKFADQITEEMKANSFTDLISEYEEAKKQYTILGASLKDYNDQIVRIKRLISEHKELNERLTHFEDIYYKKLSDIIYNFYKNSEKNEIQNIAGSDSEIENIFKTLDGLDHQIEYLQQLYEKVTNDRNKLVLKAGKLSEEASKYKLNEYKYRNKSFTQEQFDKRFDRDEDYYDNMYNRYDRYGNTVYVFNDYYRSSFISDFLWWDLISDGHLDGNFIPEVHEYHSTHADYTDNVSYSSYDQS